MSDQASFLDALDSRLRPYSSRLRDDVGLSPDESNTVATKIHSELGRIPITELQVFRTQSPLPMRDRLRASDYFAIWSALTERPPRWDCEPIPTSQDLTPDKAFLFIKFVVSLYASFAYPGDVLFEVFTKLADDTVAHRCGRFLRSSPVREVRHAVAHGNWTVTSSGRLLYWNRPPRGGAPQPFDLVDHDFRFLVEFARVTSWSGFAALEGRGL